MRPVAWPLGLTSVRLLLGPVMIWLSLGGEAFAPWLVACLFSAGASDILDGILARRLGVATPGLRRFDSYADLVFWLCALGSAWLVRPSLILRNAPYIGLMLVLEAATYALSFVKFGRGPSTHSYLAKASGLVLLVAVTAIIGFGEDRFAIPALFVAYAISFVDIVAILLLLPNWGADVPSAYHAWLIRRNIPFRRHQLFH